ncbi:MAG: alpha/beta hydrolase [Acinetobacter sp.]
MKKQIFFAIPLVSTSMLALAASPLSSLPGYTEGAQVISVPKTSGQIDEITGIVYAQNYTVRSVKAMKMNLLVPRTDNLKPAILYFPGGGFKTTDYQKFYEMRAALAKAGYVVAAVDYSVIPNVYPAPVVDGKAAIRYLRAHAKQFNIDPNKIGVIGDSAGGWLSQMLGVTNQEKGLDQGDFLDQSSNVQAAVTMYGISNLLNIGEGFADNIQKVHASPSVTEALLVNGPAFSDQPGAPIGSDTQKALNASPMGHLNGKKPPFLIMAGSADPLVSPVQSSQLYNALKKNGTDAKYILVNGAKHGDITWFQPTIINLVVDWFKKVLPIDVNQKGTSNNNANL